jgi:UDP-N-acetylmuramoyl-L-alanyl-D-glutamate--2,6-diaminopimelate ligase
VGVFAGSLRPRQEPYKQLSDLCSRFGAESSGPIVSVFLSGLSNVASDVHPGDLFVALPGARTHGAKFIDTAIEKGAHALLTDAEGAEIAGATSIPVVVIDNPREQLGAISAWMYDTQQTPATVFGVTGTNGKTSVVYLLSALENLLGIPNGLSSTAERKIADQIIPSGLTTPESPEMHALLACMNEQGAKAINLEISAQALTRHRVDGIVVDVAGFTNFSHDHLDDYSSLEDYFAAKSQLFTPSHARKAVINVDEQWGQQLASTIPVDALTVATDPDSLWWDRATWKMTVTHSRPDETAFHLDGPQGAHIETSVPVMGTFMAANAALAMVMLLASGIDLNRLAHVTASGIPVAIPGRLEIVSGDLGPTFYLDYAHTPEAFSHLVNSLTAVTPGKVIFLFGADGDRDASKRFAMGAIPASSADEVIITDYHPRSEDPAAIRSQLLEGARSVPGAHVHECADIRQAIRLAISMASEGDAIIYAGPGHETEQEVAGGSRPFHFKNEVRLALHEAGFPPREEVSA